MQMRFYFVVFKTYVSKSNTIVLTFWRVFTDAPLDPDNFNYTSEMGAAVLKGTVALNDRTYAGGKHCILEEM